MVIMTPEFMSFKERVLDSWRLWIIDLYSSDEHRAGDGLIIWTEGGDSIISQEPSRTIIIFAPVSVQFQQRGNYLESSHLLDLEHEESSDGDFLVLINWPISSDIYILK